MESVSLLAGGQAAPPLLAQAIRASTGQVTMDGPEDRTAWSRGGTLPPSLDMVGRTVELQGRGALHGAAPGGLPNAFPTGTATIATYLQAEFPGTMIPQDAGDLRSLSDKLNSSHGALTHDQVLNLMQEDVASEQLENTTNDVDDPDPLPSYTVGNGNNTGVGDADDTYVPLSIDANAFKDGDTDIPVLSMSVVDDADPSASLMDSDQPADVVDANLEGQHDTTYQVLVEWADGTTSSEACTADNATSIILDQNTRID